MKINNSTCKGFRPRGLPAVIGILYASPSAVFAYGTERSVFSKIANAECALQLSVGRIPGTAMPPEWAASGAKLGLALEVEFSEECCAEYEMTKERLLGSGSFRAVEPLTVPTFVSTKGQETVKVTQGAYGCQLERLEAQQFSFRFFLDFPEGAIRNDVELPAERIYFMSSCWIENVPALERAQKRQKEMERSLRETQDQLLQLNQESNLFQKALSVRQTTTLVEQKEKLQRQLTELTQSYPLDPSVYIRGPNGLLFAKEGVIAVKRYRGALGTREQYHWVGTFAFREFFEFEDDDEEDA